MTVPVPATREEAWEARFDADELADMSPLAAAFVSADRTGFDAGYAAGLRRAAEIARGLVIENIQSTFDKDFNYAARSVEAAILAEIPEGSE